MLSGEMSGVSRQVQLLVTRAGYSRRKDGESNVSEFLRNGGDMEASCCVPGWFTDVLAVKIIDRSVV